VIQEATRLSQMGQEMGHELRRARRELASLDHVIVELSDGFKELSLYLATLGSKSAHPIAWRATMDALAEQNRQANALRTSSPTRTPGQILQDMESAAALRSRQKELERNCEAIGAAHTQLLELLSGPELSQMAAWLPEARQISRQAAVYPAENWSRGDAVAGLSDELTALEEAAGRLELADPAAPIPEEEVAPRLEAARLLIGNYQKMHRRVAHIRLRLGDLQASEQSTQQELENARSALVQIGFIVHSNEFLSSAALQEHERLTKDVQNSLDELAQRQRGSVEKKARQAASLIDRAGQAVNTWLERLSRDTQELAHELSAMLKELDEIAVLDEKPVTEARRLLTDAALFAPTSKMRLSLNDLIPELKRRSDHWQACMATLRALGDFKPLIETHKEAVYQRQKAHQALSEAAGSRQKKRGWPPTSVTFEAEHEELDKIDQQWQTLKEGQSRALARVAQLSNLGARYQALSERIAQAVERRNREQAEAEELEGQVNDSAEMWQNLLVEYQGNPQASGEIRQLLEAINHELAQIRRNYGERNADYPQTMDALKALIKRLRYFQVELDEQSALDASGRVHRRRESQRGERF
jgi:hypothetical protein